MAAATNTLPMPALQRESAHPDAVILLAWEQWLAARRACNDLPLDVADEVQRPFDDIVDRAEEVIRSTPARTPAGVAVKLRVLLFFELSRDAEQAFLRGEPLSDEHVAEDWGKQMMLGALRDAERLAAEG